MIYQIDKNMPLTFEGVSVSLTTGDMVRSLNVTYGVDQFTETQYATAVANAKFLNQALAEADALGAEKIVFPKGEIICVCYYALKSTALATAKTIGSFIGDRAIIYPFSNQQINLNDCTIKVIFDSDLTSGDVRYNYAKTTGTIGYVFAMTNVSDIEIYNGTILGDVFYRSFLNVAEKSNEQTTGIRIQAHCHNIDIYKIKVSGFMGDNIHCTTMYPINSATEIASNNTTTTAGIYNNDGSITASAVDFYSSIITIDRTKLKSLSPNLPNTVRLTEKEWGFNFLVFSKNPKVIFLNDDNSFNSSINIDWQTTFQLPFGVSKLVIQFYDTTYAYLFGTSPKYTIREIQQTNIHVDRCFLSDSHRGGITPMCEDFKITNCYIINNGKDSGINAPLFPDSTRYGINCEDSYPYKGVIRDNVIQGTHTGIIMYGNSIVIENNDFIDCFVAGVVTYINQDVKIINNRFINCGHYTGAVSISGENNGLAAYLVSNNVFKSCTYLIEDISTSKINKIIASNNIGVDIGYIRLTGDILFTNNKIETKRVKTASLVKVMNSELNSKTLETSSTANLCLLYNTEKETNNLNLKNQYFQIDYSLEKVVIKGVRFRNCFPKEILPLGDNYTIEYIDCEFIDTMIQAGCGIKSDYKRNYKTIFKNCKIELTTNYTQNHFIFCPLRLPTANIQTPEFEFYNCDINVISASVLTLTYSYYKPLVTFSETVINKDLKYMI